MAVISGSDLAPSSSGVTMGFAEQSKEQVEAINAAGLVSGEQDESELGRAGL